MANLKSPKWLLSAISGMSLILAIISLFISLETKEFCFKPDSILATTLTILVTALIGWQISSFLISYQNYQTWERRISESENKVLSLSKEMRNNFIGVASCLAINEKEENRVLKIKQWLDIIKQCMDNQEGDVTVEIASTMIASQIIQMSDLTPNELPDQKDYAYLWEYPAYARFLEIADKSRMFSQEQSLFARLFLQNIKLNNPQYHKPI